MFENNLVITGRIKIRRNFNLFSHISTLGIGLMRAFSTVWKMASFDRIVKNES